MRLIPVGEGLLCGGLVSWRCGVRACSLLIVNQVLVRPVRAGRFGGVLARLLVGVALGLGLALGGPCLALRWVSDPDAAWR